MPGVEDRSRPGGLPPRTTDDRGQQLQLHHGELVTVGTRHHPVRPVGEGDRPLRHPVEHLPCPGVSRLRVSEGAYELRGETCRGEAGRFLVPLPRIVDVFPQRHRAVAGHVQVQLLGLSDQLPGQALSGPEAGLQAEHGDLRGRGAGDADVQRRPVEPHGGERGWLAGAAPCHAGVKRVEHLADEPLPRPVERAAGAAERGHHASQCGHVHPGQRLDGDRHARLSTPSPRRG